MNRQRHPAGTAAPAETVALLVVKVIDLGDELSRQILVDCVGPAKADDLIKNGRQVLRRIGAQDRIRVHGLLTQGGVS